MPKGTASFKYTNCACIYCVALLAWATYLLLCAVRFVEVRAAWIAVVAAGLWMLHPYWVSTTLYVVQRMTILSGLFMLAGMVGYLKGRLWLMQPAQHRPLAAYALMTSSAGMGTLLAVLSKKTAPYCPCCFWWWRHFCTSQCGQRTTEKLLAGPGAGLACLAVLAYLAKQINFTPYLAPSPI
ncbi:MAG: hypothetical protein U1E74_01255 [Paenacidovorax caeni]